MKKIAVVLSFVLILSCFAACGTKEEPAPAEPAAQEEAAPAGETAGGWHINTDIEPAAIPDDAAEAFDKAMEGFTGANYVPVALLGSQVVAGQNLAFLCKETLVTADPVTKLAVVTIYKNLEGGAEILNVADFEIPAALEKEEPAENGLAGGWHVNDDVAEGAKLDKDSQEHFDKALEAWTGVAYTPIAMLGTQVVAGSNAVYLCKSTTVTADPVTSLAVVKVYNDLGGNSEILQIAAFDIADYTK